MIKCQSQDGLYQWEGVYNYDTIMLFIKYLFVFDVLSEDIYSDDGYVHVHVYFKHCMNAVFFLYTYNFWEI